MSKKLLFNFNREVIQNYTYVKYVGTVITATNTLEKPIKSAILKGSTKYRDIDTGEFLETFEEGRNLELVSVRMPVLTTSNEDGTKTNILTVNEDVTLRGVGDVKDELDLLTGEVAQRVGKTTTTGDLVSSVTSPGHNNNSETICFERFGNIIPFQWNQIISADWPISNDGYNSSLTREYFNPLGGYGIFRIKRSRLETENVAGFKKWLNENPITIYHPVTGSESIKTVDLSILDQNENKVSSISSFNDTTHIMASSETIPPIFEGYLATKEVE